ncbi:hypothetical protein PFISCL1PPCAC_23789, partial [Pristionchus fissidentatus]
RLSHAPNTFVCLVSFSIAARSCSHSSSSSSPSAQCLYSLSLSEYTISSKSSCISSLQARMTTILSGKSTKHMITPMRSSRLCIHLSSAKVQFASRPFGEQSGEQTNNPANCVQISHRLASVLIFVVSAKY